MILVALFPPLLYTVCEPDVLRRQRNITLLETEVIYRWSF